MTPVPDIDNARAIFGDISHMPKWADLPEEYRRRWHHQDFAPCAFVSGWFHSGIKEEDWPTPRAGIDRAKAFKALHAILSSWEPKHEHKIAGAGFLANEWFEFEPAKPEGKQ